MLCRPWPSATLTAPSPSAVSTPAPSSRSHSAHISTRSTLNGWCLQTGGRKNNSNKTCSAYVTLPMHQSTTPARPNAPPAVETYRWNSARPPT